MSGPEKQGRSDIRDVERDNRRQSDEWEREENLRNTKIVSAINAIANQLAANETTQERDNSKRTLREKITIGLIFFTFSAAFVGDVVFYKTMMDARLAQRPAMSSAGTAWRIEWQPINTGPNASEFYKGFGRIHWTWQYSNFGHGLAVDLRMLSSVTVVGYWMTSGYSIPSGPGNVPPSRIDYTTTQSLALMHYDDFQRLLASDGAITLRSEFTYKDVYGTKYTDSICLMRLATGAYAACNEIH